jgi:3-methyladenine DNA glycosylase AlkD
MNSFDAERTAAHIEAQLRVLAAPERAEAERRYLKSELDHLGLTVWQIRREVKAFGEEHLSPSHAELVALVQALWSRPLHERRMAAAMLLEAYPALVGPTDLTLLKQLIRESRTWALVDVIAGDVVGQLLIRHPRAESRLDRWAVDRDFWVRRAALLAMLEPLKHGASFRRFAGYADGMLDETEFFIRKAIGWVLREMGKRRPQEVFEWLAPRTARTSGVTIREAVKYLDPDQRDELLNAYREKRNARSP